MDSRKGRQLELGKNIVIETEETIVSNNLIVRDWPGQFVCQPKPRQGRFDNYYHDREPSNRATRSK